MIELLQITNDPAFAARCDALGGFRLFVDLELMGKQERQAGRNTHITTHSLQDVARIKAVLKRARLMVRLNPLHDGTAEEVAGALAGGADLLMLPMFSDASTLSRFASIVHAQKPRANIIVPLLETRGALESIEHWIDTPGLHEVFVGLNDLHLELGCRFMFEPLAQGHVARVAKLCQERHLPFGFGGIARMDEGQLSGRDVLSEHVRLGSSAVIVSRTFQRSDAPKSFEEAVAELRHTEARLHERSESQVQIDYEATIKKIAACAMNTPAKA
jgi:HpcH/HpaI aldolase/citrate lyase family